MEDHGKVDASEFWSWFAANQAAYRHLTEYRESLLHPLEDRLSALADGLTYEISKEMKGICELVIGVSGRENLIPIAKSVVAQAPDLPGWAVRALRPPQGFAFIHNLEGFRFDPRGMRFDPMSNESNPSALGLRVFVPEYGKAGADRALKAVWNILDTALGEEACLREVKYLEVCPAPPSVDGAEHLPLSELPAYIEWSHRKG